MPGSAGTADAQRNCCAGCTPSRRSGTYSAR